MPDERGVCIDNTGDHTATLNHDSKGLECA